MKQADGWLLSAFSCRQAFSMLNVFNSKMFLSTDKKVFCLLVNLRSKLLNVRSKPLNVRSEPLNVRSKSLNGDFIVV